MVEKFFKRMNLPPASALGKRVYKKLFYDKLKLTPGDKKALKEDVESITWEYTLKPSTISLASYRDERVEYDEVELILVNLKKSKRAGRLGEIIHRGIPYPLILIFLWEESLQISLAGKRFSQGDKEALVAEDFISTGWIMPNAPTEPQRQFLDSLDVTTWPGTNFLGFYRAAAERVTALLRAEHTGVFSLESPYTLEEQQENLNKLLALKKEELLLLGQIKKELPLGKKVELNSRIKKLRDRIKALESEL